MQPNTDYIFYRGTENLIGIAKNIDANLLFQL